MDNVSNPYLVLGLMPGSSPAEIKRRYRQLAKQYHPDINTDLAGADEKLRALNAAYAFLSDSACKETYDSTFMALYNPARVPQPSIHYVPRRPRHNETAHATVGLTLLLLLSVGVGVLFNVMNGSPTVTGLYAQIAGKSAGKATSTSQPTPTYTFIQPSDQFDTQKSFSISVPTGLRQSTRL